MQILALSKYKKDNTSFTYSIESVVPSPINEEEQINFEKVARLIIGDLKRFIIKKRLYPFYSSSKSEAPLSNEEATDKRICDDCYKYFPFYTSGAVFCDAFYDGTTLTLEEIASFLKRYPSAIIGYIVNTVTSKVNGKHWVTLVFTKDNVALMCPESSTFEHFEDGGRLLRDIGKLGYGMQTNMRNIQFDYFNCGLLCLLCLIMYINNYNIKKSVDKVIELSVDSVYKNLVYKFIDAFRGRLLGEKMW
jgi:hypothetical protein